MLRLSGWSCLTLLVLCFAPVAVAEDGVDHIAVVRKSLSEDEPETALQTAIRTLEYLPESIELLELTSQAAEKAAKELGEKQPKESAARLDLALWYTHLALDIARRSGEEQEDREEAVERLTARIEALDPLHEKTVEILDGFAEELIDVADSAQRRKLYANAVDLYTRCQGTNLAEKAAEKLERFYENKRAIEILLASGLDVPVRKKERFSPERLAAMDARHSSWENAYEFKGDNYTIKTNMGYEIGRDISLAMEQISNFYIRVFGEKPGRRCWISVYKTRAEFDEHDGPKAPTIRGFFRPGKNYVATYDPASDGRPTGALWSTLFHEASHQFTERALTGTEPTWLNEGTASYFEGAELKPSGMVETNLIPDNRLRGLMAIFEQGFPTLKDVISHDADGSYPGAYYYPGWGLVYFLHNYEDEECERVYLPLYKAFMRTYKSGRAHDVAERFEEYFIEKAKQPGIETLEDFEKRFRAWMEDLYAIHFGPSSQADVLIARARKQREHDKLEAAVESYKWALRKRSHDPVAAFELAEVFEEQDLEDQAVYTYRKAWRLARELEDPEAELALRKGETGNDLIAAAQKRVGELDRRIAEGVAESEGAFVKATTELAGEYATKGLARRSLRVLEEARQLIGHHPDFDRTREEILAQNDVELRRWRRLPLGASMPGWVLASDTWTNVEDGLRGASEGLKYAFYPERLPVEEGYRFEVEIDIESPVPDSLLGLTYAVDLNGAPQMLVVDGRGGWSLAELTAERGPQGVKQVERISPARLAKPFVLAVEISKGTATYWLDDLKLGSYGYDPSELQGGVGIFIQASEALFKNLRVRY